MRILLTIVSTINSRLSCSDAHFGNLIIGKLAARNNEFTLSTVAHQIVVAPSAKTNSIFH